MKRDRSSGVDDHDGNIDSSDRGVTSKPQSRGGNGAAKTYRLDDALPPEPLQAAGAPGGATLSLHAEYSVSKFTAGASVGVAVVDARYRGEGGRGGGPRSTPLRRGGEATEAQTVAAPATSGAPADDGWSGESLAGGGDGAPVSAAAVAAAAAMTRRSRSRSIASATKPVARAAASGGGGGARGEVDGAGGEDPEAASRRNNVSLSVIRCGPEACVPLPPAKVITAEQLSVREASLIWSERPRLVLVVRRWKSPELLEPAARLARWLREEMRVGVVTFSTNDGSSLPGVRVVAPEEALDVDLVVCIGGDGTVLHASSMFPGPIPPTLPISGGSLGFMTSVAMDDARRHLQRLLRGHLEPVNVSMRMRMQVTIHKSGEPPRLLGAALNEVLLDRGGSPFLAMLDAYVDGMYLTTVQADGIIIATPTGSTAYSLSAGGSIAAPTVPCILFTPICPHTLSFRPVLLPDSSKLRIVVPPDARASASCSLDGRTTVGLAAGDSIEVSMSRYPLPLLSNKASMEDWLRGIRGQLHWNMRQRQQGLGGAGEAAGDAPTAVSKM